MTASKRKKAEAALMRRLRQPGHKAELREFNAARRGASVRGTSAIPTKKQKARTRTRIKAETRSHCGEEA